MYDSCEVFVEECGPPPPLSLSHTHIHIQVADIITKVQNRWRYNIVTRGRPASALLDHQISANIVKQSLGKEGLRKLYMFIFLGTSVANPVLKINMLDILI